MPLTLIKLHANRNIMERKKEKGRKEGRKEQEPTEAISGLKSAFLAFLSNPCLVTPLELSKYSFPVSA